MRRLIVAILLAVGIPAAAEAQAGPEVAAQQYAEAIRRGDYAAAARLMHPTALRQLLELFEPLLEGEMFDQIGPALFSVPSRAQLARTADTTLFASFLRNALGQQAGLADALRSSRTTILGHVPGGPDTTFVVARVELTVEGVALTQFDVMPFARHQGQWRGLLKADFTNMAAMMRRALTARGRSGAGEQ